MAIETTTLGPFIPVPLSRGLRIVCARNNAHPDAFWTLTTTVLDELVTRVELLEQAESRLARALRLVEQQAKDDGLWFSAKTAPEAYLQQALRALHFAVEGDA